MTSDRETPGGRAQRQGCYTTARVVGGRVERVERHAARLRRDAARLGLPLPERVEVERLLLTSARSAFDRSDGIVRIEWSGWPGKDPALRVSTRGLGEDPDRWRVRSADAVHPGPEARHGTKSIDVPVYDRGREEARLRGVDEVLLFDREGFVVEGASSNLLVVTESGRLVTPDPGLGAVEGLGLTIVLEQRPEVGQARLQRVDLRAARELMGVNAVRGVVPIVSLDGEPVGDGSPGPWGRRLREPFFRSAGPQREGNR